MANKENSAKKIDLSSIKKINFAKLKKLKSVNIISKIAIYFVLICIGYVYLKPIFEMISKSIMTAADLIDPSITWIAKHATLDNFTNAIKTLDVPASLINSIWFSGLLAIAQTAVSAMTGFALSRYTFRGRNIWYIMLILAFILPVPLLTVPRLMIFTQLYTVTGIKLIGSIAPQFLMALLGQGTYSTMLILIFYNFFNMIPKSLDEAAMIDGAGSLKVFYHVAIRLSLSTILVVFLFSFVFNWNETYTTNTMLRNAVELVPVKLSLFDSESGGGVSSNINEAQKMAATLISIAPLLILYALVQKQFIQGIENTGITGE
ncbi:MAG: carbohydrate ABC transporter permease [Eubacterium sp.]